MEKIEITASHARRFLIAYHGLDRYSPSGREASIMEYINKVGSIQFDPLDICGRNAELVLQARVRNFRRNDLERLLYKKRLLTEGWDKMMCIYGMTDYPYFTRRRNRDLEYYHSDRCEDVRKIAPEIINEINRRGPLSSLDLDFDEKIDWAWAPAKLSKAALEILFFSGQLAIDSRVTNRRKYDIAKKLIPKEYYSAKDPNESDEEHRDWRLLRRLGSLGLYYSKSGDGWLGMEKKKERDESFARLLAQDKITEVEIKGMEYDFFIRSRDIELLNSILQGNRRISRKMTFLAPLDNFMWDRFLIEKLFGFQYRWEVYKPAEEREYGYYVLPVLYGDKIIGRFEPVRNKKNSVLTIKNWWWEEGVNPDAPMNKALVRALRDYSSFLESHIDMEASLKVIYSE